MSRLFYCGTIRARKLAMTNVCKETQVHGRLLKCKWLKWRRFCSLFIQTALYSKEDTV